MIRKDNGSNNALFLSCQIGLSDGAFFTIKHTPLPNGNHPILSSVCPMGVADTLEPSPSSKNRICQQLEQEKGESSMPTKDDSLMIKYNRGKRATVCYNKGGRVDQKCLIL